MKTLDQMKHQNFELTFENRFKTTSQPPARRRKKGRGIESFRATLHTRGRNFLTQKKRGKGSAEEIIS